MAMFDRKRHRFVAIVVAVVVLAALGGCASISDKFASKQKPERDNLQLVAVDFVNAISQIKTLHPSSGTLRFHDSTSSNALHRKLQLAMQDAGYQTETVADPDAINLVSHRVSQNITAESGATYTYEVSVGNVSFRRAYAVAESGSISPATDMYVKGGDASTIKLDDSIFTVD